MDDQNKNLILATVLSFAVIVGWTTLFPPEELPVDPTVDAVTLADDATLPSPDAVAPAAPLKSGISVGESAKS